MQVPTAVRIIYPIGCVAGWLASWPINTNTTKGKDGAVYSGQYILYILYKEGEGFIPYEWCRLA